MLEKNALLAPNLTVSEPAASVAALLISFDVVFFSFSAATKVLTDQKCSAATDYT